MKATLLIIGILIGGLLGFAAAKIFQNPSIEDPVSSVNTTAHEHEQWQWPENLDALAAAPNNHKIVFENENLRILAVILDGKKSEPVHTHQWKSIMWIAKPIVPCKINNYRNDANGNLVKADSVIINEMPVDRGQLIDPEGPTSITNLSPENGVAYRVEFKKEFAK